MNTLNRHIHTYMENVHECSYVYIYIYIYRNPKTFETLTTLWFRYETFYYLFEFKVFRHEERETQFLQQTRGAFRRPLRAPKIVYLLQASNLN